MHVAATNLVDSINIFGQTIKYISLRKAEKFYDFELSKLPFSYRILLENLLRNFDGKNIKHSDIKNLLALRHGHEIFFSPSRVLMQDYTGVPAVADLAAMRDKINKEGLDPNIINPVVPVSLIIDHSISVDSSATKNSLAENIEIEYQRNSERYKLLKWAQSSLRNFTLFPPGSGICHQINIEYLAEIVSVKNHFAYFDSVVGTDSHTTMVNSLSVLGWGVGGIEAEAVMLGQPISMQIPEVVGVKIFGNMQEGITATDVVLHITEELRNMNVVGKFVEFYGPGINNLSLSERSTIANMAPEYGATCGFFPTDGETIDYLQLTGRKKKQIHIVEKFSKLQGIWHKNFDKIEYSAIKEIDLTSIDHCISGPSRPQDKIKLRDVKKKFITSLSSKEQLGNRKKKNNADDHIEHGNICLSAITSCTNTSNPSVLIMAGLVAKKAISFGMKIPWWVKTSFAPGSKVAENYLKNSKLLKPLSSLGFDIVGYGCTTCIGNSGPLSEEVSKQIENNNLNVCSVISGNRNFEGRIHPLIKSNFLASPPLVVVYALAGKINIDLFNEPIQTISDNKIFFSDLWPKKKEIEKIMKSVLSREIYKKNYSKIFEGDSNWKNLKTTKSEVFKWSNSSTYIKKPPFLDLSNTNLKNKNLVARPLLILGDSITTDHISPAGVIKEKSSAGKYLQERQINQSEFNSYGSRRGNHEIMVRGTFANIRIKNKMVDIDGGFSIHHPSKKRGEVYSISARYKKEKTPLVVFAGKEYGTGSSRDWAAKGTKLLGINVVIAESFERIHRSNLVGMGVLPLQLSNGSLNELKLKGNELVEIKDIRKFIKTPNLVTKITINYPSNKRKDVQVVSRIDTFKELMYYKKDGILPYVMGELKSKFH